MTTQILRGAQVAVTSDEPGFASLLGRMATAWSDYWRYRRTVSELETLTERELADIGLDRSDIDGAARGLPRNQR